MRLCRPPDSKRGLSLQPLIIVIATLEQDDAAVNRHGVEDHGQPGTLFVRIGLADARPDGTFAFGASDGIGDEDGIVSHSESVTANLSISNARRSGMSTPCMASTSAPVMLIRRPRAADHFEQ